MTLPGIDDLGDAVINIAPDKAREAAHKVIDTGNGIKDAANKANQGDARLQNDWFGVLGGSIAPSLNQILDWVSEGMADVGILFEKGGESMKWAVDHIAGKDEHNGATFRGY